MNVAISVDQYTIKKWEWPGNVALWIFKTAKFFLGIVGVVLAVPFLILLIGIGIVVFKLGAKSLKNQREAILTQAKSLDEREQLELHLEWQRIERGLNSQLERWKENSYPRVLSGFRRSHQRLHAEVSQIELELRSLVYPNWDQKPSEKDLVRLKATFEGVEDWDDPALDIYDSYYSK